MFFFFFVVCVEFDAGVIVSPSELLFFPVILGNYCFSFAHCLCFPNLLYSRIIKPKESDRRHVQSWWHYLNLTKIDRYSYSLVMMNTENSLMLLRSCTSTNSAFTCMSVIQIYSMLVEVLQGMLDVQKWYCSWIAISARCKIHGRDR